MTNNDLPGHGGFTAEVSSETTKVAELSRSRHSRGGNRPETGRVGKREAALQQLYIYIFVSW